MTQKAQENTGHYVKIDGESFYKIENVETMRPFFMTLVSPSDHWLFIASNGGLTAGRKNPESSLFPYYTDDKIIDFAEVTGSKSIVKLNHDGKTTNWEPFSNRDLQHRSFRRNLYKNTTGNKLIFEEVQSDYKLTFRYMWSFSEKFGFVKRSEIINDGEQEVNIEILDGLQNILPSGVNSDLQSGRSTLVDAYKKSELDASTGLGIISLSSMIVDRAEPSEALKATSVWTTGQKVKTTLLSTLQLDAYRRGEVIHTEIDVRAEKGAYLAEFSFILKPSLSENWLIVSEVNQDHSNLIYLQEELTNNEDQLYWDVLEDLERGTRDLRLLVGTADGIQKSNDALSANRHFSNVLFNIMRGGIFCDDYSVDVKDFLNHLKIMNVDVWSTYVSMIDSVGENITYSDLIKLAKTTNNSDFTRLCYEYLPLFFSRRHGDPSRPWNYFSIETTDESDNKILNFEGNWRDIFQNWEALGLSFPLFIESFIAKFVNASTIDGYNPYRISRSGIDWEVEEEHDPWSYIGYWGDHQIIYLLKLLELSKKHHPAVLNELLNKADYVYANVPYRIKSFADIKRDPQNTVVFDAGLDTQIRKKAEVFGADAKLCFTDKNGLLRATLAEKILVTVCTKLYNFVPSAGIWLNTQRPEWNDANNALVGNGVSMVTVYYLRRFLAFGIDLFEENSDAKMPINKAVGELVEALANVFEENIDAISKTLSDSDRNTFTEKLGLIGESYRSKAYAQEYFVKTEIFVKRVIDLFTVALKALDTTIANNKREDGLYHAYNLIEFKEDNLEIEHLYEMLEGQVAAISSGYLKPSESLKVLDALKRSAMFREDQYSYLLYPNRELPRFLDKNIISKDVIASSPLLKALAEHNDKSLFVRDIKGVGHFNGTINNADDVEEKLAVLEEIPVFQDLVKKERHFVLDLFESLFNHKAFTGRSGTFYGYEGLGSIYWHMVSKLLLAVQENILAGYEQQISKEELGRLISHYYEIRAGIGVNKSPGLYGAFPTDAYSHTPGNAGAQQPGMTGQVKEDIISRWAELGVIVENGSLNFKPLLLRQSEFYERDYEFVFFDVLDERQTLELPSGSIAFTYCQVPIIYTLADRQQISIYYKYNPNPKVIEGHTLSTEDSASVFGRNGAIERIEFDCVPLLN